MSLTLAATPNIVGGTCTSITLDCTGVATGYALQFWRDAVYLGTVWPPTTSWVDSGFTLDVSASYHAEQPTTTPPSISNYVSVTPKSLQAPTIGTSSLSGTAITTSCTPNGSAVDYWNVYRDIDGSGYSVITTRSTAQTVYDDGGVSHGQTATYKWGAVIAGYGESISAASNSVMMTTNYTDTIADTFTVSDGQTDTFYPTDTLADTVTFQDLVLDQANYTNTISDTVTMSDYVSSAQSLKTDFTYYLGTEVGAIYETSLDYQYDDSATSGPSVQVAITPTWYSKAIDFVEADEENTGRWKAFWRAEYMYRDWGEIPVSFSVSNDGGTTWTTSTRLVGSGNTGKTEHAHFHFAMTGQFFVFKLEWPSSTTDFQFLGFDAVYQEMADQWEVT